MEIPEHPEIARTLKTGYPVKEDSNEIRCVDCEIILAEDDAVYIWDGDYLCEKCLMERIEEQIPIKTIAEAIGIVWKSSYLLSE